MRKRPQIGVYSTRRGLSPPRRVLGVAADAAKDMPASTPLRNNVIRLLESRRVPHRLVHIESEAKLGAAELAERAGLPPHRVYKTLVVLPAGRGRAVLAVIPGDLELNLKSLRAALADSGLHMATQAEAERVTGFKVGAISPLALLNRGFEVVLAVEALAEDQVFVSAGERGASVGLPPQDLIALVGARVVEGIARPA
jgi:Cys-tRNA(Pro)/Cys-tRNA(Cys) deacylase